MILKNKKGLSLIEILLVFAILSISFFPLAHIFTLASPVELHTDDEYMATLLAQHIMETIIAKRALNKSYIPSITNEYTPVVSNGGTLEKTSEFFNYFEEYKGPITENNDPQLYWEINKFKCKVDTYLLDDNMFKIVVYVSYNHEGRDMKVYFERLFAQNDLSFYGNESSVEED